MTRRVLKSPVIDGDALQTLIVKERRKAEADQIYTRSQVRLETAMNDESIITAEIKDLDENIAKTTANLENLNKLLGQLKANRDDLGIELDAVQTTVHSLKQSGVTL